MERDVQNPLGRFRSMRRDLLHASDAREVPEPDARIVPDRDEGFARGVDGEGGDAVEVGDEGVGAGACEVVSGEREVWGRDGPVLESKRRMYLSSCAVAMSGRVGCATTPLICVKGVPSAMKSASLRARIKQRRTIRLIALKLKNLLPRPDLKHLDHRIGIRHGDPILSYRRQSSRHDLSPLPTLLRPSILPRQDELRLQPLCIPQLDRPVRRCARKDTVYVLCRSEQGESPDAIRVSYERGDFVRSVVGPVRVACGGGDRPGFDRAVEGGGVDACLRGGDGDGGDGGGVAAVGDVWLGFGDGGARSVEEG